MSLSLERAGSLGNSVTRQNLYDLLSNCSLTGTAAGVSVQHTIAVTAVSEAPAVPSGGDTWWYDLSQELMKVPINSVKGSPCSLWLSVGPDAWQIPVLNSNDYTLRMGELCAFKAGGGFYEVERLAGYTPADNSPREHLHALRHSANARGFIGAVQSTVSPGEFGALTWYGFGYADVGGFGDDNGIPAAHAKYNYPSYLAIATNYSGTGFAIDHANPYYYVNILGAVLSHPTTTTGTMSNTVCPCLFTGPWNSGSRINAHATNVSAYC